MITGTAYHYYPLRLQLYLVWAIALYSAILPMLTMALLKRLHRLRGRELPRRYHIIVMMIVGIICYALYAFTMMKVPSLMIFRKIAVAGIMCCIYSLVMLCFTRRISTLYDAQHCRRDASLLGTARHALGFGYACLGATLFRSPPQPATALCLCWRIYRQCSCDVIYIIKVYTQ